MNRNRMSRFIQKNQYAIASLILFLAIAGMTGLYVANRVSTQRQELAEREAQLNEQLAIEEEQDTLEEESVASVNSIIQPQQKEEVQEEEQKKEEVKTKEEDNTKEATNESVTDEEKENGQEKTTVKTEQKADTVGSSALKFTPETDLSWPLQGDVILNYSMDQTVYFPTLEQYKYNPALIIKGDINAPVYAAASGRITDISTNEETGTTVTMELGSGYSAIYGQLKEVLYKPGTFVEAGSAIGYVAEPTKYYTVEGSNLYFELQKDGKPVNPMQYLQ